MDWDVHEQLKHAFVCHILRVVSYHLDNGKKLQRLLVNIEKSEILFALS